MEILTTSEFHDAARDHRAVLMQRVPDLIARAPVIGEPAAMPLDEETLLGWKRTSDRLELWYVDRHRTAEAPPLSDLSRAKLRAMDIEDALVPAIWRARSVADLLGLPLTESQRARLVFLLHQKDQPTGFSPQLTRRAENLEHLNELLRGEITELLLNLDESQVPIVELRGDGPILVKGVAGSGKTAVALHRIRRLLRERGAGAPPRILFLTYTRTLTSTAAELLRTLGVRAGSVEVANLHGWCHRYVGSKIPPRITGKKGKERATELLRRARDTVRKRSRKSTIWSYPDGFWEEEIHRIKGHVLGGLEEYKTLVRSGSGRALDSRLRELVWEVCEEYRNLLASERRSDWDDLVRKAHDEIRSRGESAPVYDHVFVDEGQDLTPIGIRIASLLAGGRKNLYVSYDAAQSIYEKGFRWKNCGVVAHGSRSYELLTNHRNTQEIVDFARPILSSIRQLAGTSQEAGDEEHLLEPLSPSRRGTPPQLHAAGNGKAHDVAAKIVRTMIEEDGVRPQNIAVLTFDRYRRYKVGEALQALDVRRQIQGGDAELRLADPSVKVMTMHSAKGLQFPVVVLVVTGSDLKAPRRLTEAVDATAYETNSRKLFYMAMTRAMVALHIVHREGDSPITAVQPVETKPRIAPDGRPWTYEEGGYRYHWYAGVGKRVRGTKVVPAMAPGPEKSPSRERQPVEAPSGPAVSSQAPAEVPQPAVVAAEALPSTPATAPAPSPPAESGTSSPPPPSSGGVVTGCDDPDPSRLVASRGYWKYHRTDCPELAKLSWQPLRHQTVKEALSRGMKPCGTCKP